MGLLDLALRNKPDLVCLPETFTTAGVAAGETVDAAEGVPGPTTDAVAKRAASHRCYVICPVRTRRAGRLWNSAVVIDRSGVIVGTYDKMDPVTTSHDYTTFENGVMPGSHAAVFDLDFGRIGIQICFDAGFPEHWEKLAQRGARLVIWPSAYNGGFPLQVYASLHEYYVVSSVRSDRSRIIDPCGQVLAETDRLANVVVRDINLDYLVCHLDFNYSVPDLIMDAYPGRVDVRLHHDDGRFLVEPTDAGVTTEQLRKQFGFEPARQYFQRHREAYCALREGKQAQPQVAAHGNRPQYTKWQS